MVIYKIYVPESTNEKLEKLSRIDGLAVTEIINRVIRKYVLDKQANSSI